MEEKLIQVRVSHDVKLKCDKILAARGINVQGAVKMMLTQIANSEETPFDQLFSNRK